MPEDRVFARRMLATVFTVAGVVLLIAALWAARAALRVIYVSAIIAMGFSPLVGAIERKAGGKRRVPRTLAILVIYLTILAVFVSVGAMVIPPLLEQGGELWSRAPGWFNDVQRTLIRYRLLSPSSRSTLAEAVQSAPKSGAETAIGTVFGAIFSVVGGVFGIVTILILSFYLLVEGSSQFEYVMRFVPERSRAPFIAAARQSVEKVSAWLSAQFILAAVMGLFAAGGLGFMGVPYFYVVALIAALGETIPIVGPIVAGSTAVLVALSVSGRLALVVGVYFLALHQLEANILVPKIMERRVGVSPVTVIIALLVGAELWGLVGAVLAIPTAAILAVIVDELTNHANQGAPS
jgi:predicted PurR-regulated permease PerM